MSETLTPLAIRGIVLSLLTNQGDMRSSQLAQTLGNRIPLDMIQDAIEHLHDVGAIQQTIIGLDGNHTWGIMGTREPVSPAAPERTQWFGYRHITPLFAGTPEFIVERLEDNKLYAWCPCERTAARITEALNQ